MAQKQKTPWDSHIFIKILSILVLASAFIWELSDIVHFPSIFWPIATGFSSRVHINKLTDGFGATLVGLDFINMTDDDIKALEKIIWTHKLVLVRGNKMSLPPVELHHFSRRFGTLAIHVEGASRLQDFPEITRISNIRDNTKNTTIGLSGKHVESFHADLSWSENPATLSILQSVKKPAHGGDTIFIDTQAAYEDLPQFVKDALDGSTGKYCYLKLMKEIAKLSASEIAAAEKCAIHPIFRLHPIINKVGIYANPSDTTVINEVKDRSDSDYWLRYLFDHVENSPHRYVHRWQNNDLLFWDNRAVQHKATGCPPDEPRLLYRTLVLEK